MWINYPTQYTNSEIRFAIKIQYSRQLRRFENEKAQTLSYQIHTLKKDFESNRNWECETMNPWKNRTFKVYPVKPKLKVADLHRPRERK